MVGDDAGVQTQPWNDRKHFILIMYLGEEKGWFMCKWPHYSSGTSSIYKRLGLSIENVKKRKFCITLNSCKKPWLNVSNDFGDEHDRNPHDRLHPAYCLLEGRWVWVDLRVHHSDWTLFWAPMESIWSCGVGEAKNKKYNGDFPKIL